MTTAPARSTDPVVSASGLTRRFGDRVAVADLDLAITAGHAFGLLGPNGAGKTTTVRLLNGLLPPTSGSVTLFGEPLTPASADRLRARVGVQTDTNLYESLSVSENLRTWGRLYGLRGAALDRRIDDVLDLLRLTDRTRSLVGELSKGMRQKLSVGRAILHDPALLYLDEPTAGLDPEAAVELLDHVREMMRTSGTTVVICTHQLYGLETLCDEVGIIAGGRMAVSGPVAALIAQRWPQPELTIDVVSEGERAAAVVAGETGTTPERTGGRLRLTLPAGAQPSVVVAALVRAGVDVAAVVPTQRTVQDLYFATIDAGQAREDATEVAR